MDTAFHLDEEGRANFLNILVHTTRCSYVCLWSSLPLSSCLCCLDGFYQETGISSAQPSSSSGSLARILFDEYRKFIIDNNHSSVPGFAFRTNHPYVEVMEDDLPRLATNHAQRQFYQEASIKKAVFMGCPSGEIEVGFSNAPPENTEALLRALFPEDFSRQAGPRELPGPIEQQKLDPPSSSSSSWRSLSLDSPEYSSLLFSLPSTIDPQTMSSQTLATTIPATTVPQHLRSLQAFARIPSLPFPNVISGSEHEAMTKAFLTVISSPSSSTSSSQHNRRVEGAFRRYNSPGLPPVAVARMKSTDNRHQSMIKRSIAYFRRLHLVMRDRVRAQASGGGRPTSTQLHHMMSERKRREKLNESLQALKALLPPGTKRDKASVLASTRDYLASLKAQIEELRKRNAALETKLLPAKELPVEEVENPVNPDPIEVRIGQISESNSQGRTVNLQVVVRRECSSLQLAIRILEFLRQLNNVHLVSMDSDSRVAEDGIVTRLNMRLRTEGDEWDESAFEEAVRRLVADVAQIQI